MAKKKKDNDAVDSDTSRFPQKYAKLLPENYQEEAEQFSTDQLKEKLAESRKMVSDTEKQMEVDVDLNDLKEQVKEISGAYKDVIKVADAKGRFLVYLMESKGIL